MRQNTCTGIAARPGWGRLGQAVGIYKLGDTVINTESVEENWLDSCYVDLFELWDKLDTLPSDGLQIFADYNTTIVNDSLYAGYPIYLVNETSNTKMVFGRINNRIMQEALDSNGRWRPIEYRPDFCAWVCGNGYFWGINIRSNEYLLVYLPKYSGNYKTKMRIRVRGFNTEYISNPFDGIMNYSQFYVRKDICMHWYMVLDRREEAINGAFGGTVPLGYDEDFSH